MIKVVFILFTTLVTLSYGQYLRQQHPPAASWGSSGAYRGYGGNVGYNRWSQPANVAYGGGYRAPIAPVAYGGSYGGAALAPLAYGGAGIGSGGAYGSAYRGAHGGAYGGAYVAPAVGRVTQPIGVAQPQYGGGYGDESYKPFSFGYNTVDEYGTQMGRQEAGDGSGAVRGSYSYRDPTGQFRQVQYVADAGGFRAEVNTNEAGVVSHRPADAVYNVQHK